MLCGVLGAIAILRASFALFCCATFFGGFYGAVAQSYRFAAADGASAAYRPKAVSWVMAGGVFAGVLGPQLVQWTMDIWPPYLFAVSFMAQTVVALVAMALLSTVDAPKPAAADLHGATLHCGGDLRRGVLFDDEPGDDLGAAGLALEALAAIIGISGITALHFWSGLVMLGIGWNFGFIGASALVLETHRPAERNKVQAFNDFLVFGLMAVGSFSSGQLLANYGWSTVNAVVFPPILLGLLVLAQAGLNRPRRDLETVPGPADLHHGAVIRECAVGERHLRAGAFQQRARNEYAEPQSLVIAVAVVAASPPHARSPRLRYCPSARPPSHADRRRPAASCAGRGARGRHGYHALSRFSLKQKLRSARLPSVGAPLAFSHPA
eukprot:gene1067-1449_t